MSWFFAISGSLVQEDKLKLLDIIPEYLYFIEFPFVNIWAGGIKDTCKLIQLSKEGEQYYSIICGNGFKYSNDFYKLMDDEDWRNTLILNTDSNIIEGSFIFLSYFRNQLRVTLDRIGTRFFYFAKYKDNIILSTRLDLISKFSGYNSLDYSSFSSLWLLQNQIGNRCLFKNIEKCFNPILIDLTNNNIFYENKSWKPQIREKIDKDAIINLLFKYCNLNLRGNKKLSLSLSGGLDSRFLLSLLISCKATFDTHTFGSIQSKDVLIAQKIAEKTGLEHHHYYESVGNENNKLIDNLRAFIRKTSVYMPISEFLHKRYYPLIQNENKVIIDAGFGEILRNGLYYKIALNWKKLINRKNFKFFLNQLKVHRANIFNDEFTISLYKLLVEEFEHYYSVIDNIFIELFSRKPRNKEDFRLWLDIFSIFTKHLNYCAIEQIRTDEEAINYTPFLQPTFLDYVFSLNYKGKNNGKLIREFINSSFKDLTNFPLVKNNHLYPFTFNTFLSKTYINIKNKINSGRFDCDKIEMIMQLSEFIKDTELSSNFKQFELYDFKKINKLINGFFLGDTSLSFQMDWFITFEIFRQELMSFKQG